MTKQVQEAYIVAATRTPVGKAPRGMFRNTRPDDLLAHVLKSVLAQAPSLDPASIGDVIVGCAMPEAEQGMNVARIALLLAGLPDTVPGMTVNRFCSSGVQAVALAADRIRLGEADVMIAAGVESMSMVPMMGNKIAFNPAIFENNEHCGHRLRYGADGGKGGGALEGYTRCAGCVCLAEPFARHRRDQQRRIRGRNHALSHHRPRAGHEHPRSDGEGA